MKCQRWSKRLIYFYTALILLLTFILWNWRHDDRASKSTVSNQLIIPPPPLEQVNVTLTYQPPTINLPKKWPQFKTWVQDGWTLPKTRLNGNHFTPLTTFIQDLQDYAVTGHTHPELDALGEAIQISHSVNVTVAIYLDGDLHQLDAYLGMLSRQTVQPTSLWILWASSSVAIPRVAISNRLNAVKIPTRTIDISNYSKNNKGGYPWIKRLHMVSTAWVWLLDMQKDLYQIKSVPNNAMEYLYRTSQLPDYQQTLLGLNAMLLPSNVNLDNSRAQFVCLPSTDTPSSVSQPADLLYGAWLINKMWLASLVSDPKPHTTTTASTTKLPLPYHISYSLRYHLQIPTIFLPSPTSRSILDASDCNPIRQAYLNNKAWIHQRSLHRTPTALDYRQTSILRQNKQNPDYGPPVMYLVDGAAQAKSLIPLFCQPQRHPIHIVVTGQQHGLSGKTLRLSMEQMKENCSGRRQHATMIHDLDLPGYVNNNEVFVSSRMMSGLGQLIHVVRPEVLIHVLPPSSSSFESLSLAYGSQQQQQQQQQGMTLIHLPANQIRHALWIADLPLNALKHWNSISIQLVVITDRRPHSFSRLLQTCGNSYFLGDQVDLTINMEQSADKVTRNLVNSFDWVYGSKTVRHRIQKGGLMPAIIESWYPNTNDDYAVILEDDISVSPLFYTWAKYNILKYRYGGDKKQQQQQQHIFGISLYSPRNVELHLVGRRPFDPNQVLTGTGYPARTPYVGQTPCSWGAVYFPEHWREFHGFLSAQLEDLATNQFLNISLPMSRSDRWKKSWKKYFIQMVYLRGYVMIYPNFQSFESFATNHLEMGTHVQSEKRVNIISMFLVPLMQRDTLMQQLPNQRLPDFDQLPVLDLWGHLVNHRILEERAAAWHSRISACERRTSLTFAPDDLLCPFTHIPAWDRPDTPLTTKKVKVYTMTELVEPLTYMTAPAVPLTDKNKNSNAEKDNVDHDNDLDWPLSIDVALMAPPLVDNTSLVPFGDDQWQDLRSDLTSLLSAGGPLKS